MGGHALVKPNLFPHMPKLMAVPTAVNDEYRLEINSVNLF